MEKQNKPFFPNDKPKSWVIGVSSCLLGLGFGFLMGLGHYLEVSILINIFKFLFILCFVIGFPMVLIFNIKYFSGQYRQLQSSSWSERPW